MAFLEVRGLTKRFGSVTALDDVSFDLARGEWLAVVGPSGSGKSTLLHCVAQLQQPDGGSVILEGVDIVGLPAPARATLRREALGIVFQRFHLLPYLTAVENVMLAQYFHSTTDRAEAVAALERVGLGGRLRHLPSQLSGGERQRVCIARALINRPKLVLADEPTGSLDAASQASVLDLLSELHQEGHAIVTVTHDAAVGRRADRELVLEHGRTVGQTAEPHDRLLDEVVERAWLVREGLWRAEELDRRDLERAAAAALVTLSAGIVELTPAGEARARDLVRRRRLAERLVQQALGDVGASTVERCSRREHRLAAAAADATCAFLGHPRTCPHDRPIPPGPCCDEAVPLAPERSAPADGAAAVTTGVTPRSR